MGDDFLKGIIVLARMTNAAPTYGQGYEMDAIGACFIGGASAYGGVGTVGGTIIGALLMGVITQGMVIAGIDANYQPVVKGLVLLLAVMFSDNWKNLGALLVRNTSIRSNREAGDGSTTVSLLFSELCKAGAALVDRGIDQNEVAKAYKAAAADMIEAIQKYKKTVSSDDDILNIATISANNDSEIGNYVLEAFQGIGEDGVVSIKDSYNGKTFFYLGDNFNHLLVSYFDFITVHSFV